MKRRPIGLALAARRGRGPQANLVDGGLPVVLSQTFRAVIHSRMAVGLSKYKTQYRGADVVLFQPEADDSTIFFTNIFSYATRRQVCEHADQRTRVDLQQRAAVPSPLLARHGMRLARDVLADPARRLDLDLRPIGRGKGRLHAAADGLRGALQDLRRSL